MLKTLYWSRRPRMSISNQTSESRPIQLQVLFLTALFTAVHLCAFSVVRYSASYLLLVPKWCKLLRSMSFLRHYVLDWLFCFVYTGIGCYVGRRLFRQTFEIRSGLISDPLGLVLATLVFNSLLYVIAVFSHNVNPFVLIFMQEFGLILASDILVLTTCFYAGAVIMRGLGVHLTFDNVATD